MTTIVESFGLTEATRYFEAMPEASTEAARIAINQTASRGGLKLLRQDVSTQVNFPPGYLNNERLGVTKKATNSDLEAIISARERPTSLARFADGEYAATGNRFGGVRVQVKPGVSRAMPQAFLMRLRAGASLSADNYNIGLAIRLKPGERIMNKNKQSSVQLSHNLYLLYAPSVDQVFRSVASDDAPVIGEMVADEFFRQYDRIAGAL